MREINFMVPHTIKFKLEPTIAIFLREIVVGILILSNIFVWLAICQRRPGRILSVYFLDIGQGDAIFVDSPRHGRALVDGGANRKVLSELGKILPFADKRIDIIVETHPD